jgi:quercetin dioxygenase-like cupin family protein
MMREHTVEEGRERAALYALGALRGEEIREFEQHLAAGCVICAEELAAFTPVVAELGHATPPQMPRAEVRARVLERIGAKGMSQDHPVIDKDLLRFVGSNWLDWRPGNGPGIEVKLLAVDQEHGYYTTLVRMAPGSSLAPHRHVDPEESYILEGELLASGVLMRPGDYCHAAAGSLHTEVTTKIGCVFIAVASIRDERLAANA